ncbi:hypothetical protein D3C73_1092240 [compost metagenome]
MALDMDQSTFDDFVMVHNNSLYQVFVGKYTIRPSANKFIVLGGKKDDARPKECKDTGDFLYPCCSDVNYSGCFVWAGFVRTMADGRGKWIGNEGLNRCIK